MLRLECSGVIFDLDGVLVDSAGLVEQQWRRWANARGVRPEPLLRICHGRRAVETIRLAAPHLDAEAEAALLAAAEDRAGPELRALPGASRLLGQIPGPCWAVATSGTRAAAAARLRGAGLPEPAAMICAEDVAHGKPHPEVYQRAAIAMGLPPGECVVIEDAPAGIEAARAAGMLPIGLCTTHPAAALPADTCAASLADIHLGRIEPDEHGRRRLELLVIEIGRDRAPAGPEPRRAPRAPAAREPRA
jgi:sugar-phosphatase